MPSTTVVNPNVAPNGGAILGNYVAFTDTISGVLGVDAAHSVDIATVFTVAQTTNTQALTIASPTNAAAGTMIYIVNIGAATGTTIASKAIGAAGTITAGAWFVWTGAAWK